MGLVVRIEPIRKCVRECRRQPQYRQQTAEPRELHEIDPAARHQIIQVERTLLVLYVTIDFSVVDGNRRRPQGPGLAQMIKVAGGAIVAQHRTRPIDPRANQALCLCMIRRQFALAGPRALRHHDGGRRHRSERDNAHRQHNGNAALMRPHDDFNSNMRTISSPDASTIRNCTARGIEASAATAGHTSTQANPALR